jgi:hypothetical protein
MPRSRKLRIETSECLVASGPLGVRLAKHSAGPDKVDARPLGLLPGAMLAFFDALGDARLGKLRAVVERGST